MTREETTRGRGVGRRHRTPVVLQMEATECGAACLAMVLGYHGRFEPLEVLRDACGVSRNGSRASLILRAAREYGLEARGFRVLADRLDDFDAPMILFWNFEHFVVYEGRSRDGTKYYLNDPATGPRTVDREEFEGSYTGVALVFSPGENFRKGGKPFGVVAAMLPMLRGMRSVVSAAVVGGLLLVIPGMVVPGLMRVFVDEVMKGRTQWLTPLLLLFTLTLVLRSVLEWLVQLALRRGELQNAVNGTLSMLRHVFALPMPFFMQRTPADIQNRVGMNASIANAAFGTVADSIVKFFTAVFFLILMLQYSVVLTGMAVLFAGLNIAFLLWFNRRRQTLNQSLQMERTRLLSSVMSGMGMMESLRASGREEAMFTQWTGQLAEVNARQLGFQVSTAFVSLLPTFLDALSTVLILCVGAWEIMEGSLTLGGMFAFQTLVAAFTAPFTALVLAGSELQVMKAEMERVRDVFANEPESIFAPSQGSGDGNGEGRPSAAEDAGNGEGCSAAGAVSEKGEGEASAGASAPAEGAGSPVRSESSVDPDPSGTTLELRDVTFGYSRGDPPLVEGFNLRLCVGRRVALVGGSGSGKSTVARLATGLLRPWSGEILLNGRPLSRWTREEFYSHISAVDQNIMLFSGSMRDNLTLFASGEDGGALIEAVRDACMEEELARRGSNMLELEVAENGGNFSGGQRQRLEIARVLARRTPLLVLDEATSALDPVTEKAVMDAVRARGCGCLVVAHRLSTVRDCDEILVLEGGRVVERGNHAELMAENGIYATLMRLEEGGV